MNNEKKQEFIDKKRWITSEKAQHDCGGTFDFCSCCEFRSTPIGTPYYNPIPHCNSTYEQRSANHTCAKAYNKFHRKKKTN